MVGPAITSMVVESGIAEFRYKNDNNNYYELSISLFQILKDYGDYPMTENALRARKRYWYNILLPKINIHCPFVWVVRLGGD